MPWALSFLLLAASTTFAGTSHRGEISWSDENRERLSPVAVKAFFRMMDVWRVEPADAQALLGLPKERYEELRDAPATLDAETLTRVSFLLGIFKSLNTIYADELADRWIQAPNANPMFGGKSPLKHMVDGGTPAMRELRSLVDAVRWGN